MKNAIVFSMLLAAALAGCNKEQQQANGNASQPASKPASKPASTARKQPRRLTAARIAQIGASGKTGLWAEPADVCSDRVKRRAGICGQVKIERAATWNC